VERGPVGAVVYDGHGHPANSFGRTPVHHSGFPASVLVMMAQYHLIYQVYEPIDGCGQQLPPMVTARTVEVTVEQGNALEKPLK